MLRARITKQVERIAETIDSGLVPAEVQALYVFGSFTRGAAEPDDLDLIVLHDLPSSEVFNRLRKEIAEKHGRQVHWFREPSPRLHFETNLRRAMRKPGEKIDILLASTAGGVVGLGRNISTAQKVLVWSKDQRDWRRNLATIKPGSTAGRFERGHFASLKRFRGSLPCMEDVSEAVRQELLKLTRIDADGLTPELNTFYEHVCQHWVKCNVMGRDSLKLLPYGLWWLQRQKGQQWARPHGPLGTTTINSDDYKYVVHFGLPQVHGAFAVCADEHRKTKVCMIPHFRRGQKNEMFVFERGVRFTKKRLADLRIPAKRLSNVPASA